jgi:tRNA threonylcarbamoyladenosine modification (KEOPS) complex  Pcc1 subunit
VGYLSRSVRAVLVASLLLMAMPLSAGATGGDDDGDQSNTVDITIRGGDASALAACLNVAKEKGRGDVHQQNDCRNKAYAVGGSVYLKNVDILTVQENRGGSGSTANQANTVNLTIRGGDASALATCLNVAKEKGRGDVYQENDCENKAYASGGTVVLKNVDILTVQENRAGSGSTANQSNTVNLTIQGGDANALATCLNVAKEKDRGDVRQKNDCENTAYASGGIVVLKNVDITVVQANTAY